jgi:hypothetical protein
LMRIYFIVYEQDPDLITQGRVEKSGKQSFAFV